MRNTVVGDLDGAGLQQRVSERLQMDGGQEHTLPQDPQVLESPLEAAPHLGQDWPWKLTRTVVDCILNFCLFV
jgi:hypothetical protein